MIPVRVFRRLALVALGLAVVVPLVLAGEEEPAKPTHVEAVVYEVFHGDTLHRMGHYVREVHVPERGFAFNVAAGELRVYRPDQWRYAMPGDTMTLPDPEGGTMELPIFHVPGTEPKLIRSFRMPARDADQIEEHLKARTRLRAVADGYLLQAESLQPVVGFTTGDRATGNFVWNLLAEAGILCVGVGNAGGETLSVPPERAQEARRLLREALVQGLARTASDYETEPAWDAHLTYQILGEDGTPEWYGDRTRVPPAPPAADVFGHLQRFQGSEIVTGLDTEPGWRRPAYGDLELEQAEIALKSKRPRPWTVSVLEAWFAEAKDEKVRAALVYVLAASRNASVLPLVGTALSDEQLHVRVAATHGVLTYWRREPTAGGGTEQAMLAAREWWNERQTANPR